MAWKSQMHQIAGVKAAMISPKTPKHLVPHLQNQLAGFAPDTSNAVQGMPKPAVKPAAQAEERIPNIRGTATTPGLPITTFRNPFRKTY